VSHGTVSSHNVPVIAIVGRPNVGKSTLFNRLVGHRTAIVHDLPGVTRDRHYSMAKICERRVELIDTGGFQPGEEEGMLPLMREQAQIAIAEADAIIFLTNARDGVTVADEEIADVLRRTDKPVLLAANKCDSDMIDSEAMAMYSLGFDMVYPVAAEHNRGVLDLCEAVIQALEDRGIAFAETEVVETSEFVPDAAEGEDPTAPVPLVRGGVVDRIRVCFVGRPNVGKSTLVNQILGQQRVIAADQPGTTRDAIDIDFQWHDEKFTLVDTAGLRRKRAVSEAVEQYSVSQAVRAIERCHLAVLVLDATQSLADQDAKVAALVENRNRACVIAINKWDAVEKETMTMKGYEMALIEQMPYVAHVPRVFLSAKTGQRVDKLMETVRSTFDNFNRRVPTAEFNKWLMALMTTHQPPTYRGRPLKMYYGNQLGVRPPQFVVQINSMGAISPAYERFLIAQMRETWELGGTPLRLKLKEKVRKPRKQAQFQVVEGQAVEALDDSDDDAIRLNAGGFQEFVIGDDEDWEDDEA
jgi:GTP-binding protein